MKATLTTSLVAVALSALLASGAAAGVRPDDRPGPRGPAEGMAGTSELDPALAVVVAKARSRPALDVGLANALASARNAATREQLLDPAMRNALAGNREPGTRIAMPASAMPQVASDGFHWRDAVVGAGFAFALVALAFVAVRLARRSRPEIAV